jgi:thiol-disulfide isomerase/thioredoxin
VITQEGMMMRFLKAIYSLLAALILIWGCDVIEPPYLIVNNEVDTTRFPVPEFPDRTEFVKKVLLEDFTGHKCGNCPKANEEIIRLEQVYHDQLIPVAIHVTDVFASADETGYYTNDYRTPTGDELDVYFGIEAAGLPRGLVNRAEYNTQTILSYSAWEGAIAAQLSTGPVIDIQIITQYDADSNDFAVHVQAHLLEDFHHTLNLSAFIIEDSIVSAQKDYNHDPTVIEAYTHRHMLRASLNGTWGDPLFESSAANGQKILKSYHSAFNMAYNPLNCSVVAFVYDADTREVLQAEEVKIIK